MNLNRYKDIIKEQEASDEYNKLQPYTTIITAEVNTPYVSRASETISCQILKPIELPGINNDTHLYVRTSDNVLRFIKKEDIVSIDGEKVTTEIVNEWDVTGSHGDIYKVTRKNAIFECTCPHYFHRKIECKHIKQIKATL